MSCSQEYIKKNANLRNNVVIGNEDAQDLLANNTIGRVKQIKVDYVWFKVKMKQLICTLSEYHQNFETISKYMNADSSEFGTLNVVFVDNLEIIRIREYHTFSSELILSQISKVVSYAMIFLIFNINSFLLIWICFAGYMLSLLQIKWALQIYILFLSRKKNPSNRAISFTLLMSDLGIPRFFLDTFIARLSKMFVDYAWSGYVIKSKPSNLPKEWVKYSENHENLTVYRKVMLLRHTQPVDAFALGFKSLQRNTFVPKNILKQIKKDWCRSP